MQRIENELRHSDSAFFLTFTYDGFNVPYQLKRNWSVLRSYCYELTFDKQHVQKFMKRLRKYLSDVGLKIRVRYYLTAEYGGEFERPHYHMMLFGLPYYLLSELEKIWGHGFVDIGQCESASIHYVTKYVINRLKDYGSRVKPFALMSRNKGIGYHYVETHKKWHRDGLKNYTNVHGFKRRLARYYKDQIFTSLEKEKLRVDTINERDLAFAKQLEELGRTHHDPLRYYNEQLLYRYNSVERKINKK